MRLKVLTFNCWGVPVISRDRAARMRAIARELAGLDVDVVGLQEVFVEGDRRVIARGAAAAGLIHTHYFASGVMGSGLMTLSRYPIEKAEFLRFKLNGRPQDLIRSDYYAGKGIGQVRLATPEGPVDVYNAHLIAPYLEFGPDRFAAHRLAQALEAGDFIRTRSAETTAILTCDLNCPPDSLPYRALMAIAGLVETYREGSPNHATATVAAKIPYARLHPPERLDYIFARSVDRRVLTVRRSELALAAAPRSNPEGVLGFSDHYGIMSELELVPAVAAVRAAPRISAGDPALSASIAGVLGTGIRLGKTQRRNAGIAAATASLVSAALFAPSRRQRTGGRSGFLTLAALALAGVMLAGGINLTTAAHLGTEVEILRAMMPDGA